MCSGGRQESRPLAERWDGAAWSILPRSEQPAGGALLAVTCTSTRSCIAVGHETAKPRPGARAVGVPLAESWDGSRWSVRRPVRPASAPHSELSGVSCVSATDCVAVGVAVRRYRSFPLLERWNGSRWAMERAPSALDGSLSSVSCTSRDACVAVGDWQQGTLITRWNGHHWSTLLGGQNGGEGLAELDDVSCSTRRACVAVGGDESAGGTETVTVRWDGRRWTAARWRVGAVLRGVSCTSARACTTVGDGSVIGRWVGRRWTRAPVHADANFSDVSCTSATTCVAVASSTSDTTGLVARES